MLPRSHNGFCFDPVSALTRYGFALFIAVYGVYQMANEHLLGGLLAIAVAAAFVLLGRRR